MEKVYRKEKKALSKVDVKKTNMKGLNRILLDNNDQLIDEGGECNYNSECRIGNCHRKHMYRTF